MADQATLAVLDRTTNSMKCIAIFQIILGVLGFFLSFAYIDHILTLSMGGAILCCFNGAKDPVARARAMIGSCARCAGIAEFVFGSISIIVFAIIAATIGSALIVILSYLNGGAFSSEVADMCNTYNGLCTDGKSLLSYLLMAIILGVIWPAIYLVLAGIQTCKMNALQAALTSLPNSQTVVIVQPGMIAGGQPGMGYPQVAPGPGQMAKA